MSRICPGNATSMSKRIGERILMLEYACYSVLVPASGSTLLFKVRERREAAAEALKPQRCVESSKP